jgi:hypothetical protein
MLAFVGIDLCVLFNISCRNPGLGLATKARGLQSCGPSSRPGSHITCSRDCRECEGMNLHTPKWIPMLGVGERWSPKGTPKTSEGDLRLQDSMACGTLYINGKLLEGRCLKWARIAHLYIWNTSYGQKKGLESNSQFDFWPLKVGNRPNLLSCRECATYRWKCLNKSHNFSSDHISIGGLLAKLWGSKVAGVPTWPISGPPSGNPKTKSHLDVAPVESHRVYYKGEGGGFPQVRAVVSLVCPCCPWLVLAPKVLQLCTNHFVWVLCRPVWVSEACQLFLV